MNVLHTFFVDFEENDVQVHIGENYSRVLVDYESIHVAFYHILENASKYIKQFSTFSIKFSENPNNLTIAFLMDSLYIEENELEKIFIEGYSGINAHKAKRAGEGIGMSRIKRLVELNDAEFTVIAGKKIIQYNGQRYSKNQFFVDFKIQNVQQLQKPI